MKKFFAVLYLFVFLAVLVAPLANAATSTPSTTIGGSGGGGTTGGVANCCQIRRTFEFEGDQFQADDCVTEVQGGCDNIHNGEGCPGAEIVDERWGMICVLNTIFRVADLIFLILLAVSILLILLAAWTFITAGGAPEKVNKARDYIFYALIGLVVAFLARAIPSIVKLLV